MQAGSWRDLSDMQDDTVHSNPFLTLWFDHGTRATAAAYAYAILPGKTAAGTQAYAAAKEITILAHDSSAHAVRQNRRDMTGIVFWNAGSVGGISVDRPCVVFCEEDDEGLTLAVSDPTHAASAFRITLDEQLVPERLPPEVVSTIVGGKTVVTYHAEKGRNYLARFRRWR
jgi:hyaluronate lyase